MLQDDVADLDQLLLAEKAEAEKKLAWKQNMNDLLEMELKKRSKGDDEGGASNGNDDDDGQWQRLNAELRTLDDENAQLQKDIQELRMKHADNLKERDEQRLKLMGELLDL